MATRDRLYEESRFIRKAVKEGRTTPEIMRMLSLSAKQIRYRIETRYSKGIAKSILKRLDENDGKEKETAKKEKSKTKNKGLVVDTSSLGRSGAFEFITNYSSVILLDVSVKEMEKHKSSKSILGKNIRRLLAASAGDKEEKYEVRIAEKVSNDTDENVLHFCKGKDVILYTADNAMATLAKAYDIEYILAEDKAVSEDEECLSEQEDEEKTAVMEGKETEAVELEEINTKQKATVTELGESELLQPPTEGDIRKLLDDMRSNSITAESKKTTIDNICKLGKKLLLKLPQTYKIAYVVLSEEKVKKPVTNDTINLEKGDIILVMTYKLKHQGLCVAKYEITDIQEKEHAIFLGANKLKTVDQISTLDLPDEAKRQIRNYFYLVRKN